MGFLTINQDGKDAIPDDDFFDYMDDMMMMAALANSANYAISQVGSNKNKQNITNSQT